MMKFVIRNKKYKITWIMKNNNINNKQNKLNKNSNI